MSLDKIFKPKKIAVIGASDEEGTVGYALFNNLITGKFKGKVTPVNIKRDTVQGKKAFKSISALREKQDLAIIATPAATVLSVVEECGKAGVGGIVVISAGFSEVGREDDIVAMKKLAKKYKMRIIGPNCLGFIVPGIDLNASFAGKDYLPGNIALISQSGALCTSILDWSIDHNVGFNYFVSIGEMADVGFHDLVDYFGNDSSTSSILIYIESIKDADKFIASVRKMAKNKPVVVLKSGRSAEGSKAARSHTGSLSGNDEAFDAAFAKCGAVRVNTTSELLDLAKLLDKQPLPKGEKAIIMTNAGGPGVLSTDALISSGCKLSEVSAKDIEALNKFLPAAWSHGNPVDILGDADAAKYGKAFGICMEDGASDALLVILTPQAMTHPEEAAREVVKAYKKARKAGNSKTVMASWMGGHYVRSGAKVLEKAGVPVFATPEEAVAALSYAAKTFGVRSELKGRASAQITDYRVDKIANENIISKVLEKGRDALDEAESKRFLENYGLPIAKHGIAVSAEEARKVSQKIGFPVAMKILSHDILHKVDVGGVKINVETPDEAAKAFATIIASAKKMRPDAEIGGVFIEAMAPKGIELLIGAKKDKIFGPTIVFGMGGTNVEIFKDVKVALPPLDKEGVVRMIEKTKVFQLLKGYRGQPAADIILLQDVLCRFSRLICDFPEIKEVDINPFLINDKVGVILDAKIIVERL